MNDKTKQIMFLMSEKKSIGFDSIDLLFLSVIWRPSIWCVDCVGMGAWMGAWGRATLPT